MDVGATGVNSHSICVQKMIADDSFNNKTFIKFIKGEAKVFGALVNGEKFPNLIDAIREGRINVFFAIEANNICEPNNFKAIGCSVQFPCAISEWDQSVKDWRYMMSSYGEDFIVMSPGKGMGADFFSEVIDILGGNRTADILSSEKIVVGGFAGEQRWYASDLAGGMLKKFGAVFADNLDEPVLVFPGDSSKVECVDDSVKVGACDLIYNIDDETVKPHSSFAVEWQGENCGVCATFNDAFSTFEGIATPRALFASHGVLPEKDKLKNILSVMMDCGVNEIKKKGWVKGEDVKSLLRIHVLRQSNIHQALVSLGAVPRTLGNDINPIPMYPFMIDLAKGKDCTILKAVP